MANPYRFPNQLGEQQNPFVDAAGKNPYADEGPQPVPRENLYASPDAETVYRPQAESATLPDHSRRRMWLGLSSMLVSVTATAGFILIRVFGFLSIYVAVFGALLAGMMAIPTVLQGRGDLQAIEAGAMPPEARTRTRVGYISAIAAVVFFVGTIAAWLILELLAWLND